MTALGTEMVLTRIRLPPPAWVWLANRAALRRTSQDQELLNLMEAWSAAGAPDPGVPGQLLNAGLTPAEVRCWRAVLWTIKQEVLPLSTASTLLTA